MPIINLVYEAPSGWWGWQPWANTLFYYKFENSLLNEVTWTVDASFNWSWSYDTIWWVQCVNLNNTWISLTAKLPANDFTLCRYGNFISFNSNSFNWIFWITWIYSGGIHCQFQNDVSGGIWPCLNIYNYWTEQWNAVAISNGYTTGQWYCYALVRNSWVCTLYVNWVSEASMTIWGNNSQSRQYYLWEAYNSDRYYHWYMSNAILENVAWTQQEVINYYNSTKWGYWIS